MNIFFNILVFYSLIILFLFPVQSQSQSLDTLYYYPEYSDSLANMCLFIMPCTTPSYCEPVAVWFTPDSSNPNSNYNLYSLKKIRFAFTDIYTDIECSVHLGDDFPADSNKVFEQLFSVDSSDYTPNYYYNGIQVFKEIDLSQIVLLQNLDINTHFWILLDEDVFSLYNTIHDDTYPFGSGHSFYVPEPFANWSSSECEWHIQVILLYEFSAEVKSFNNNLKKCELYQNYPNPLNCNETIIKYYINDHYNIDLSIYDISGRKIKNIVNSFQSPGNYDIKFDVNVLSSGTYIYVLTINNQTKLTKKLLLVK